MNGTNKAIRNLGVFLILCFTALFVKLNQVQVLQADQLNNHPENSRVIQREFNRPRGTITAADGALLAQSVPVEDDTFSRQRVYPEGDLFGQITGYFSFLYGAAGVEKTYDEQLSGTTFVQQLRGLTDLFVNKENVGNVRLTVRKDLQQLARDQLRDPRTGVEREGSIVVTDPRTGAILAFWSTPSYDPNPLSSVDPAQERAAWTALNADPAKPMLAKQYQERYFPGSTFKAVTSGIGLQTGKVTVDDPSYPTATSYKPPVGRPIANFGGESCGGTLFPILAISCNSAFAQMGVETIGGDDMYNGARSFGFDSPPPIDLPSPATSVFPETATKDKAVLAQASIGQNDVQATPLQMALVACAAANGGVVMTPHVMDQVTDSNGNVVDRYQPEPWVTPMDPQHAITLRQAMVGVVQNGTGVPAQIPGYEVGGKTGTAQLGDGRVHTWMIAFAGPPGGQPTVAVSVVVLNQPETNEFTGGQVAGPIARTMMQATLAVQ